MAALGLAVALPLGLAGCSNAIDRLPEAVGGEPAGIPARPTTPYQYPAVHDIPRDRATAPLSDAEQVKLEKELKAVRDRLEGKPAPDKNPANRAKDKTAKKPPLDIKSGQATGAATKP